MDIPSSTAVSERLQQDAVQIIESTIPTEMTIDEWRRLRPRTTRRRTRRWATRTPRAARHLTLVPDLPLIDEPPPLAA